MQIRTTTHHLKTCLLPHSLKTMYVLLQVVSLLAYRSLSPSPLHRLTPEVRMAAPPCTMPVSGAGWTASRHCWRLVPWWMPSLPGGKPLSTWPLCTALGLQCFCWWTPARQMWPSSTPTLAAGVLHEVAYVRTYIRRWCMYTRTYVCIFIYVRMCVCSV